MTYVYTYFIYVHICVFALECCVLVVTVCDPVCPCSLCEWACMLIYITLYIVICHLWLHGRFLSSVRLLYSCCCYPVIVHRKYDGRLNIIHILHTYLTLYFWVNFLSCFRLFIVLRRSEKTLVFNFSIYIFYAYLIIFIDILPLLVIVSCSDIITLHFYRSVLYKRDTKYIIITYYKV